VTQLPTRQEDEVDFFDPRTWTDDNHEYRIYGTPSLDIFAVVDRIDYAWAAQWLWSIHTIKGKTSIYLRRGISEFWAPDGAQYESPISGRLVRNRQRRQSTLFLHAAIMERSGIAKPTEDHSLVDHIDRDTFNCRRGNLRWATKLINNRNNRRCKPSVCPNSQAE
jgi:hypothetical protein